MKKIFFTVAIAAAFAFGMTACNNNAPEAAEATEETAVCEEVCAHECEHNCMCADTTCKEKNCEGCVNHGTENCCKAKGCEKACCDKAESGEHKCCKAEACEQKCDKAEACEHKCAHKCEHAK